MKILAINFCVIVSWVAVVTLPVFWWIANSEPLLLEIKNGKEDDSKKVLLFSAGIYLVLALVLTAYRGIFVRGESISQGVGRMTNDMKRVLRAGQRNHTLRESTTQHPTKSSKTDQLESSINHSIENTRRSSDNDNLLG